MKRVLIADDEPIERMIVTRTIQKYFPEELAVVSAANGREAVEQFFAENCQIALLDIEMPGMNGLEAAEQIRERDKNCSIIFLTAFDEFNYARRAIAVRAMEYLLKPVEDQELEAVLAEAIRIAFISCFASVVISKPAASKAAYTSSSTSKFFCEMPGPITAFSFFASVL